MPKSRILIIAIGVLALLGSFGAGILVLSLVEGDETTAVATAAPAASATPAALATSNTSNGGTQPQITPRGADVQSQASTELSVKTAQAQIAQQTANDALPPGAAAAGAAAGAAGIMSGKGHLRAQHGDWSELCQAASGPGSDRCILVQNIESANRPGFGLATVIRKVPGDNGSTAMMHIYVPLGIYLPKGLGLQIDDQLVGNTPFWSCIPFQCEARVTLPPDLIQKLGNGSRALYAVYENPTKGTVLPISLKGFTQGLEALNPFVPGAGQGLGQLAPQD